MDAGSAYTVVGLWLGDAAVPVGVVAGEHQVVAGDGTAFPDGLWATSVRADSAEVAQWLAVTEMLGTLAGTRSGVPTLQPAQ